MKNQFIGLLVSVLVLASGCKQATQSTIQANPENIAKFYSSAGVETKAQFSAVYKTSDYKIEDIQKMDAYTKSYFEQSLIKPTIKYLFGPLTNRELGGMKTEMTVVIDWAQATQEGDHVVVPYTYSGTWIVASKLISTTQKLTLPVPFNSQKLFTTKWLACTDSSPEHQTQSFFWYFWDPSRSGCDHVLNTDYQMVDLKLSEQTINTVETYPEFQKMIKSNGIDNNFQMTYAFGYVEDAVDANPDTDSDYGMNEYRKFIKFMDKENLKLNLAKTSILQKEYLNPRFPEKLIGYRYSGIYNNVKIEIKVVTSANIDQMELFAQSYAHDHDAFFSWFGHSRVGSGFDADNFSSMLRYNPTYYSLSSNYQLVYWAGCNSYSYYTQPFFKQKAKLDSVNDSKGTKNLDIIANGLPSQFSFNADNATILYKALINWNKPTSFQSIVNTIEKRAARGYSVVLVNILGDEDNTK